jgi:hypothetical protein
MYAVNQGLPEADVKPYFEGNCCLQRYPDAHAQPLSHGYGKGYDPATESFADMSAANWGYDSVNGMQAMLPAPSHCVFEADSLFDPYIQCQ